MKKLGHYIGAMHYPLAAAMFILRHPSLWLYCIIPILINIAAVVAVFIWTGNLAEGWMAGHLQRSGWIGESMRWGAIVLMWILRILLLLVVFVIVGNTAAVPFNDLLSEQVDKLLGWRDERNLRLRQWLGEMLVILFQELKRMLIFLLISFLLFVASFTGVLAPFTTIAQIIVSAEYFALDYLSFPLERRGILHLNRKIDFTRRHMAECLGFGSAMAMIGIVPVVNFLFIPLGVVGGTLLHADLSARPLPLNRS